MICLSGFNALNDYIFHGILQPNMLVVDVEKFASPQAGDYHNPNLLINVADVVSGFL